jgi:WD40 repeat protein
MDQTPHGSITGITWAPDGRWLGVGVPGPTSQQPDAVATIDTATGVRHGVRALGPVTWAPGAGYAGTPLTTITPDCRAVQVSRPDGRDVRVLAGIPGLQEQTNPARRGCPVWLLAWSPDARWLAIGLGPHDGTTGQVTLLEPLTHVLITLPQPRADRLTPLAFAWSPDARLLLVECRTVDGRPFTVEVSPTGDSVAHDLVAGDVSWSPDGRWILGHALDGWVAFDAVDPLTSVLLARPSDHWVAASWCCPATVPVTASAASNGAPRNTRPAR